MLLLKVVDQGGGSFVRRLVLTNGIFIDWGTDLTAVGQSFSLKNSQVVRVFWVAQRAKG